jgi:hypothetical protein
MTKPDNFIGTIISGAVSLVSMGIKKGASETAKAVGKRYDAATEAIEKNNAFFQAADEETKWYKANNTALVIIIASLLLIAVIVIVIIKKK